MDRDPSFPVERNGGEFAEILEEKDGMTVDQIRQQFTPTAPEGGFSPDAFPSLTVDLIPYTANPLIRPDPSITITDDQWMCIELGNVRVAIPDREEWNKLVRMGEAMWNTHEAKVNEQMRAQTSEPQFCNFSVGGELCGRTDEHDHVVNGKTIEMVDGHRTDD